MNGPFLTAVLLTRRWQALPPSNDVEDKKRHDQAEHEHKHPDTCQLGLIAQCSFSLPHCDSGAMHMHVVVDLQSRKPRRRRPHLDRWTRDLLRDLDWPRARRSSCSRFAVI
jgi:hypothetical protein